MIASQLADQLITSRLLILQSKRLLLSSTQRRVDETGFDSVRQKRLERLRVEAQLAQYAYRSSILMWGRPDHADYWMVAYGRLIEMGRALAVKLRDAADMFPPEERYELSTDVQALDDIVDHWIESMRASMAAGVA